MRWKRRAHTAYCTRVLSTVIRIQYNIQSYHMVCVSNEISVWWALMVYFSFFLYALSLSWSFSFLCSLFSGFSCFRSILRVYVRCTYAVKVEEKKYVYGKFNHLRLSVHQLGNGMEVYMVCVFVVCVFIHLHVQHTYRIWI